MLAGRRRIAMVATAAVMATGIYVAGPRAGVHAAGECEAAKQTMTRVPITDMREVNYGADIFYRGPNDPPGGGNTLQSEAAKLAQDLPKIASANANALRIFIRPYDFTSSSTDILAAPDPGKLSFLDTFVSLACNEGLFTYITLFDQSQPFGNITESESWARAILGHFIGDTRIIGIDLINEINAFPSSALTWAASLIPDIQGFDGGIPVTASDSDQPSFITTLGTALGSAQPDFYDLHYYGSLGCDFPPMGYAARNGYPVPSQGDMSNSLACAQTNAAAFGRPLVIGETGYGTCAVSGTLCGPCAATDTTCPTGALDTALGGSSVTGEENQVTWYQRIWGAAQSLGLPPPAPWEFQDFVPGSGACFDMAAIDWSQQPQWLGLYRCNDTPKPALAVVQWYFTKFQSSTLP